MSSAPEVPIVQSKVSVKEDSVVFIEEMMRKENFLPVSLFNDGYPSTIC